MAIVPMEDAVPGAVAESAEYNKLIDNIIDLDSRSTVVENRTTNASTGNTQLGTRVTTLETRTTDVSTGNVALGARVTTLEGSSAATVLTVMKTADQTVTNTVTLANDTHLFAPLTANSVYTMEGFLIYTATAVADIKFQFAGPTAFTIDWAAFGVNAGGSLTDYDAIRVNQASSPRGSGGNGGNKMTLAPKGFVTTSTTAGNIRLQFAQLVAEASSVVLYAGSWLKFTKVA